VIKCQEPEEYIIPIEDLVGIFQKNPILSIGKMKRVFLSRFYRKNLMFRSNLKTKYLKAGIILDGIRLQWYVWVIVIIVKEQSNHEG